MIVSTQRPSSRPKPRAFARRSGGTPVFRRLRHNVAFTAAAAALLLTTAALAQTTPLPANYQTILNNPDVLVMRVHYGPHEFVPMHDHSDYPTVFVYLNNSGPVRIDHAPPVNFSVTRPPTHTGAFRIAPGMHERHSITNLSDLPSDFLRVELKSIPPHAIKEAFRGDAPKPPYHSTSETVFTNPALHIERDLCVSNEKCTGRAAENAPSIAVIIPLTPTSPPKANPAIWVPANKDVYDNKEVRAIEGKDEPYEILRIVLLQH
ncbi:MAG: cupin domain-containing protein [Acidobacteriaceae bacterium]